LVPRLYQIKLGTLENENSSDSEWALRPYMNTAKKKTTISNEDGWEVDT
jgi:U3 small nucleolar ribonucleoprotein protein IMP4